MKSHTQVAVIGGGVVGASVLYHLTKGGWKDVVLIERSTLTSGSTWHAAGGFHTLNGDPNVAKLQEYTIGLYKEIEEISGQSCGLHLTAGMYLADTPERVEWLKMANARSKYLGLESEMLSVKEAKELLPILEEKYFAGAMYDGLHGHLDPSGTTQAYAKSAKIGGAEIYENNRVTDTVQREDGTWDVVTEQGTIHAEHIVNAGGLWAREVGRMVGLELPILAMEHMYLLTEAMPEVAEINESTGKEVLHAVDFGGEIYMRQERDGLLMGTYEQACVPWSEKETPWDFGHELLQEDMDRIAPSLEIGFEHFPCFQKAGIKQIINGPFTFAPDGNPLVGPMRGLRNYWVACGVMAGFSQGGGVGLSLANWMIDGNPGYDVWGMDVARYGDWATMAYTNAKVRENYSRRFSITFPNEELPAGRPFMRTPIYDRLKAENAVFGAAAGLEHVLWYQEPGEEPIDEVTFHRNNSFEQVKKEVQAVRDGVGMIETSSFAKYRVTGTGAEGWLSHLMANKMPREGRMVLAPMLNEDGKMIGDFSVSKLGDEEFYIFGSGAAEEYHMRWFLSHLPDDGTVALESLRYGLLGLSIAGPKARDVLAAVTDADVSNAAFKFMDIRRMDLGMVPAIVGRVTFTGDLGYEIWVKPEFQLTLFEKLREAGAAHGMKLFGSRALNALRLEKSFGSWATEFRPIYGPFAADMGRFIALSKNDFIGRAEAAKEKEHGPERMRVTFSVDATDADVIGDEPVWKGEDCIGWITSGGYGHHVGKSIAMGYIEAKYANGAGEDGGFEIEILGERRAANLERAPLFDANAERMRG
ncbi:MAG: FAD-dependent oxidoreductase [Pseudomonadota bacterium]